MGNTNTPTSPNPPTSLVVEKVFKLNSLLESLNLVPSSVLNVVCKKEKDSDLMLIELIKRYDDSTREELEENDNLGEEKGLGIENPIIIGGNPLNFKIPCNLGHVHIGKAYLDLKSPINIMTRAQYNWIRREQLEPREDLESLGSISNFTGRIRGMHVFVENFTYVLDFVVVEDISSTIDPRLSQVVLVKPFVELFNMTYDLSLGIVKFTNGVDEISYKMPHNIEQYDSLSDMEREHLPSVYFRNEEDRREGVDYVMSKILGVYKECLELRPEYQTELKENGSGSEVSNKGGLTLYLMRKSPGVLRTFEWLLEEIHVTLAHLEKKRTRLQLSIQVEEDYCSQCMETALGLLATPSGLQGDGIRIIRDGVRL
ncbi:hypothetical protein Tco_0594109 [Tanacetum coccineum]